MLEMIKKQFQIRYKDLFGILATAAASFAASTILLTVIMAYGKENTVFEIGTFMVIVMIIVLSIMVGTVKFTTQFNNAISMGKTRKNFFVSYTVVTIVMTSLEAIMVYAFHYIERMEFRIFYTAIPLEFDMSTVLRVPYVMMAVLLCSTLQLLLGSMVLRFGRKFFWAIWAVYMMICLLPSRVEKAMDSGSDSVLATFGRWVSTVFSGLTPQFLFLWSVIFIVVCLVISGMSLRKQQVIN